MRASSNVADSVHRGQRGDVGRADAPLLGSAPAAKGAVTAASQR